MHAGEQLGLDDGSLAGRVGLVRALILVGVALVIGGFLVFRGMDSGPDTLAAGATDTSTSVDDALGNEGTLAGGGLGSGGITGDSSNDDSENEGSVDDSPAPLTTGSLITGTTVAAAGPSASDTTVPATAVTTASSTPATSSTTASASTTAKPTGNAGVTVLVLNAASGKGVAARGAQTLKDAGYTVMAPKNADALGKSKILYTTGNQAAAEAVAAVFDVDPAKVVGALNPSAPPIAAIGDADVIVVIGTDGVIKTS